ncbi:PREDICTED: histone-lysine N-methyltransferase EHMT1 isoform X3 [Ceratosolen solmsi marchali]|uniref:Histone-lysine N-methyltransferase EHMT1 isoform X3 n=1 Tax=Ceratosolen solmsi marchali TaxID=326594 RepID=A0AAJ6YXE5_9HYME|nr:PREDICTED: histone-lysine N-methyltransferase EHMT1 isoform X3 [Ceratosolen solmsi marchali]
MSESEGMETSTITESQKEDTEDEDILAKDELNIQKILEGMTNEFNKANSKKSGDSGKKINKSELTLRKQEKPQVKTSEGSTKSTKVLNCSNHLDEEIKIIKENIPEKKSEKTVTDEVPKQEAINKKDNNIPRIVLTFRTIDENTDHGKKTKISSCASNLSLVPDELVKCDQISGVSVKIDEICDEISKSDTITCKKQKVENDSNLLIANKEDNVRQNTEETDLQPNVSSQENNKPRSDLVHKYSKNDNVQPNNKLPEEPETIVTSTKRNRQKRLRELSDEAGLKRSARRLSKESLKSTVLESAMARKEKSNYTVENTKRKYSRPGRPKKLIADKKDTLPKLNPLDPSKVISNKKDTLPKLNPLDPSKFVPDKKDSLPKLSPLDPSKNITLANDINCINIDDSRKSNKYEGMPKLTPIIKSCEIIQPKFSEPINSETTIKDETFMKNVDESFLKPIAMKSKREKGRLRSTGTARKIAKGGVFEEGLTPETEVENASKDVIIEESPIPLKRTRRNMTPSPSTAEGQASKPESTAILSKIRNDKVTCKKLESMQCLCEVPSQLFVTITSAEAPLYCTALDSVDNRIIGCCNEVDHDDVAMRRPSTQIPFIILCRMHKERLIRHNCCPTCGLFCSQGKFVHCSNGHQYHRDCEIYYNKKPLCPHCGSYGLSFDVVITMTGKRKPVYVSPRKQFSKEISAKISLPGTGDNAKLAEQQPVKKKYIEPLISPDIINIPKQTTSNTDKLERYTNISLYNAVKNGDLQKLVNILACGFNANHTFREQAHKTGLHIAADKGYLGCVHVLVQAGAQLDILDRNQLSPLMLAATNGRTNIVRYLMRIGADVTLKGEDGMTALHMAAKFGHLDVCKIILNECKVPRTLVDSVDDGGWTSLIWACEFCHADVAQYLIENKCDPLIRDAEQNIALHWSAFSGSSEITELLLNIGCDVNAVNVHGDTPLHIASRQDQYNVSILLLSRGAKVGEVNVIGETAIDCCAGNGDTMNALQLNFKVNQQSDQMLERTVKILTNDISRGKETNPVQCVNGFDSEDKPTDFVYVTENCFTSTINVDRTITSLQSCRCEDNCSSDKCLCGNISLRCWYDDEGKLVSEFNYADPPMLFECNPACDCNKITCNNRVVQHGLTQRFQLFRTLGKGWGLRTLRHILKGTYVCEYVGEIISDSEADHREDDSYLFDLDNRDGETYCIDARRYGNLARFINHSCAPNLLPVRVFIEHQDLHFPRIAFFANRNIDADEELGYVI